MKNKQQYLPNMSRLRHERLLQIQDLIEARKYPNAPQLAAACGRHINVIREDLRFMRNRLHHPIEFDYAKNGFFYAGKFQRLIAPQASPKEIEALHLFKAACELF